MNFGRAPNVEHGRLERGARGGDVGKDFPRCTDAILRVRKATVE